MKAKQATKKTTKKSTAKKVVKEKPLVESPEEFHKDVDKGLIEALPRLNKIISEIKPNQQGLIFAFTVNGDYVDGVFSVSAPKSVVVERLVHMMQLCDLNLVEVLIAYQRVLKNGGTI